MMLYQLLQPGHLLQGSINDIIVVVDLRLQINLVLNRCFHKMDTRLHF